MSMHFRPKIQNGPITKRARTVAVSQPASRPSPRSASRSVKTLPFATMTPIWSGLSAGELAQNGLAMLGLDEQLQSTETITREKTAGRSRVLLGLIGCGVLLAGGFMFSLRDHFTAHAFGRDEVKLKSKLEQVEAEQQQLDVTLKQAGSPKALDQAAREAGLAPLKMERKKIVTATKPITPVEKAKKAQKGLSLKEKAAQH